MLTQARLKELLHYCPETGVFTWKIDIFNNNIKKGTIAGSKISRKPNITIGIVIGINGQDYYAHRLIWLYMYGKWPELLIDHINGDPSDNRLSNLRNATKSQNCCNSRKPLNNTSGYKGVSWHKKHKKWNSRITLKGKVYQLGLFKHAEDAHFSYCEAAKVLHKEFANFG